MMVTGARTFRDLAQHSDLLLGELLVGVALVQTGMRDDRVASRGTRWAYDLRGNRKYRNHKEYGD